MPVQPFQESRTRGMTFPCSRLADVARLTTRSLLPSSSLLPHTGLLTHGTYEAAAGPVKQEQGPPPHCQLDRRSRSRLTLLLFVCRKAPVGGAGNSERREGEQTCLNPHTKSASAHCKSRSGAVVARRATGTASFPHAATNRAMTPWKETDSLGFDDLLTMAKLFDLAHTWIMHQQQADAKARKESEQAAA